MMCTPFLVYTYAFTYDVHDILVYPYVIHTWSHNMFITVWLFISPFSFKFPFRCIQTVYTQLRCIAIAWNFTGIWYMAHGCLDIGHCNKYTSGILHIDGNSDIFISWGWYSEVSPAYFTSILYDCALMSTHFHCIYSLYTMYTICRHSHMGFHVYEMYTYSVYNMYTSGFTFLGWLYDYETFTRFPNITFPIVPVACGCLLVGSAPPWGPGPQ